MKTVAIVGHGVVGKAVERFFRDHFKVLVYDPRYLSRFNLKAALARGQVEKHPNVEIISSTKLRRARERVKGADLAVICVPTPMAADGSCDTSLVEEVCAWIETPLVLIKSTVAPGTTDRMNQEHFWRRYHFSPEYVGESRYFTPFWKGYADPTDMKKHDFHIVGGPRAWDVLEFFKVVAGPTPRYHAVEDATEAELAKYMENAFFATKVAFCNDFAKICGSFGVEYDAVRELFLLDGRVERMHTAVFKDSPGFGGKCYPKDVSGILAAASKEGYVSDLLAGVLISNAVIRNEEVSPAVVNYAGPDGPKTK